ncbi:hypothetical protein BpHYR1_024244 [Brachionus plicatilis]|uniref:Uncharacterized protein n=1 Tax=Brachionus plicatilis TaxID=10195 RepID=A0A3M7R907_BRAPC|nr:hypothetical protein BpHYR1_024244 [Brachionus plicatilis]
MFKLKSQIIIPRIPVNLKLTLNCAIQKINNKSIATIFFLKILPDNTNYFVQPMDALIITFCLRSKQPLYLEKNAKL